MANTKPGVQYELIIAGAKRRQGFLQDGLVAGAYAHIKGVKARFHGFRDLLRYRVRLEGSDRFGAWAENGKPTKAVKGRFVTGIEFDVRRALLGRAPGLALFGRAMTDHGDEFRWTGTKDLWPGRVVLEARNKTRALIGLQLWTVCHAVMDPVLARQIKLGKPISDKTDKMLKERRVAAKDRIKHIKDDLGCFVAVGLATAECATRVAMLCRAGIASAFIACADVVTTDDSVFHGPPGQGEPTEPPDTHDGKPVQGAAKTYTDPKGTLWDAIDIEDKNADFT